MPRDSVVISTKIGRVMEPAPRRRRRRAHRRAAGFVGGLPHRPRFDYSYDGVMRSFEQSLLRLGTDRIDILLIHDIDAWTHGEDRSRCAIARRIDSGYRALDELRSSRRRQGDRPRARRGTTCASASCATAISTPCCWPAAIRCWSSRRWRRFLPLALEKGVGIMLGGIFNSGILATGAVPGARYNYEAAPPEILDRVARIEAVCARMACRSPRAAVQFVLGHPAVSHARARRREPAKEVERQHR